MAAKQSGHSRLKKALVLRDALAKFLGLPLDTAMRNLAGVEDENGAALALVENRYRDALKALCQQDKEQLDSLNDQVTTACGKAGFAPRYPQYLALLLFCHWANNRSDPDFLVQLNHYLLGFTPPEETIEAFTEADLQFAAFWMATAAGKTHVLHACLALLEKQTQWSRILIITPSESLTRQHANNLRKLKQWHVFAYPQDGDASLLGNLPPDTIIVLDINKLTDTKKGDGVTLPTSVFSDGRNLVFVDEGHKGQKSEASVWKKLQQDLAGIGIPDLQRKGLLVEFSATFGQVAEAEHAFGHYAKGIIFDYAYDRFHRDLYGKDFWHVQLDASGESKTVLREQTLTAALLAYWHQLATFHSDSSQQAAKAHQLQVASPLWVLLGLSVIGGKNVADKEQTSDVIEVLQFLHTILLNQKQWQQWVKSILEFKLEGADLLPTEVRQSLSSYTAETLSLRILMEVFGWQAGDQPIMRLLKAATGEMGLGLLRADRVHYFGVVNVGDAKGLGNALQEKGLSVEDDALTPSLFASLEHHHSGLNVLIGSRRFAEGWDNYRASSLTLLRLGQGEGSLIIQMFGRVVRFAGQAGNGKRLRQVPDTLRPLQTAYVYGLRSKYLEAFLQGLYDNGVLETKTNECPVKICVPDFPSLYAVQGINPDKADFGVALQGATWLNHLTRQVTLSLGGKVQQAKMQDAGGLTLTDGNMGTDITPIFKAQVALLDVDAIYQQLLEYRRLRQRWNLTFDKLAIHAALQSDKYTLEGIPDVFRLRSVEDLQRLQRIAVTLVQRMFEAAYRRRETYYSRFALVTAEQSGLPQKYQKEFIHG